MALRVGSRDCAARVGRSRILDTAHNLFELVLDYRGLR
jgi:hypothetical protein